MCSAIPVSKCVDGQRNPSVNAMLGFKAQIGQEEIDHVEEKWEHVHGSLEIEDVSVKVLSNCLELYDRLICSFHDGIVQCKGGPWPKDTPADKLNY